MSCTNGVLGEKYVLGVTLPGYRGRGWPSKVKSQNQKSIFKVKSQNQKSNVNLLNKKSIRKLKSRNQMLISEAQKSSFEYSLLTFDFRL